MASNKNMKDFENSEKKYDFKTDVDYKFVSKPGLSKELIEYISNTKKEPKWMLDIRLKAYEKFKEFQDIDYGPDLNINFDEIIFYAKPTEKEVFDWEELPTEIKNTFDKLGIPEAERQFLAGVGAQFESEMVLKKIKSDLFEQGVLFLSMDEALRNYPQIVKDHFSKIISYDDNKMAALNTACWSGGTFIYVPDNVEVKLPLQTYFRINMESAGQFERTMIIVGKNSKVHYIEGCTAPIYSKSNLHAAVVEVIANENSKVKYSTVQNWSRNVLNFSTKRGLAKKNAVIEWLDGNIGSGINMKYPAIVLEGDNSKADILSIGVARENQYYDNGGKIIALGKNVSGRIVNKSVSFNSGKNVFRSWVVSSKNSTGNIDVSCDSLILDEKSIANTYPIYKIKSPLIYVNHEAKTSVLEKEQLFYLNSKGINSGEAKSMIVLGFLSPITKELPFEYAIELNKLLKFEFD